MKTLPLALFTAAICSSGSLSAASLMLNFRSTSTNTAASGDVAGTYLGLSPAQDDDSILSTETSWNNFSTTGASTSLNYSDGTAATGVTLTFGTESAAGNNTIDLGTVASINLTALYGSGGGTTGKQALTGNAASIYGNGNNSANSAAGRAGWLGGGTSAAGNALGLRVDGLTAGEYRIYVMARNTNSNAAAAPVNIYSTAGALSSTFSFSALAAHIQSNAVFPSTSPTSYNEFVGGENFVSFNVIVGAGESLFLASDGGSASETRGFLNMVQIVAIPEPSALLLGFVGLVPLFRRRR
jgi:hypothetical protein